MEYITQITNKQLNFINDVDLRAVLLDRLQELDRVFLVNANYSTIFGAIGAIEGIFKHISSIYRTEILGSSSYPKNSKGKPKNFTDLTIVELYIELKNLGILPDIKEYEFLYQLFKDYRNFIHPQAQVKKGWEIKLGQAQMAIGLLNATIQNLDRNIFIGKYIFEKIAGNPYFDSQKVLNLEVAGTPHHSFLILKQEVSTRVNLTFDLDLPQNSLLNFVFNYTGEGDFKMLRLDNRHFAPYRNGVLRSSQKYSWNFSLFAVPPKPPSKEKLSVQIDIDFSSNKFDYIVDNLIYKFTDLAGNPKNLFDELHRGKKIGFFCEVGPVKLSNINII
jgi:hypothetical protein